jgi:Predicted phosphosugar isomerases
MPNGFFTRSEITSQPTVWKKTLQKMNAQRAGQEDSLAGLTNRPWIITGCGSTYYLSLYAASVLRSIGVNAFAFPASELVFFPQKNLPAGFVLLVISRSGTTTETLWAMDAYRQLMPEDGKIICITCVPDTPMVAGSDLVLLAPDAQEESVAQTRSFSSMALMVQTLAVFMSGKEKLTAPLENIPESFSVALPRYQTLIEKLGNDLSLDRFFFLGTGPFYGIANECMLKTKEMCCTWSEAYHTLEFRHGPMSVVAPSALVVGLISDSAAKDEIQVLREMKAKGARTLAICEQRRDLDWEGVDDVIEVFSGLSEWQRPMLYLPYIQWIAFHRSLAKGLDPDSPLNLTQVVRLD